MLVVPLADIPDEAVDALVDHCFGPDRRQRTAALLRHGAPRLAAACHAMLDGSRLIGCVQVHLLEWRLGNARQPLALLGPLVSHPERRNEGIGQALVARALAVTDAVDLAVALIGDAPYYARWGFTAAGTGQWRLPGPVDRHRLLLRAKSPVAFAGPASLVPATEDRRAA